MINGNRGGLKMKFVDAHVHFSDPQYFDCTHELVIEELQGSWSQAA